MSGYSLLELIISLAVLSILALSSWPNPSKPIAILEKETSRVSEFLKSEQLRAQTRANDTLIQLEGEKIQVRYESEQRSFPLNAILTNPQEIRFHSNGLSQPASIELREGTKICLIRISLRGRIRHECKMDSFS